MKLVRKYIKLPVEEKRLLLEAVLFIFFAKLFLLLPFRFCTKWLKPAEEMSRKAAPETLLKIRNAVSRANKLAFWKNICLVKSFAARFMLQRRGIGSVMYLGLQMRGEKELLAHAWLISQDIIITPKGSNFKEIYSI